MPACRTRHKEGWDAPTPACPPVGLREPHPHQPWSRDREEWFFCPLPDGRGSKARAHYSALNPVVNRLPAKTTWQSTALAVSVLPSIRQPVGSMTRFIREIMF
jgi:hypothetical protein